MNTAPGESPPSRRLRDLRAEIRGFLAQQLEAGTFEPRVDNWLSGFSPEFSRALGQRGWVGMTWPKRYGGQQRSAVERFCVMEELLAAGAPVAAHWSGDRQVGPSLLRNGTEEQRRRFLPGIAAGELYFCLGLSEPDSGSDLASVRTSATERADGSWVLRGTKLWTGGAHHKHFMLALCRSTPSSSRREGLSQFVIDMATPGIEVRPVLLLSGEHHFNEVVLDDVVVPPTGLLGTPGQGWAQVTAELADERGGPERYMSTVPLIREFARAVPAAKSHTAAVGRLAAEMWAVRAMSREVADLVDQGQTPSLQATLTKHVGTEFEQRSIDIVRGSLPDGPQPESELERHLASAVLHAPGFTLRGGTTQILRSIVSRKMGM